MPKKTIPDCYDRLQVLARKGIRLSKSYAADSDPKEMMSEWLVQMFFHRSKLSNNSLMDRLFTKSSTDMQMLAPKLRLCITYNTVGKWSTQPREILQLICLSLSPVDQHRTRKALRLTCRAFAKRIRAFTADFLSMSPGSRAIHLLKMDLPLSYLLKYNLATDCTISAHIIEAKKLHLLTPSMFYGAKAFVAAISTGQLSCLKWLCQIATIPVSFRDRNLCDCAARYGQLPCLQFLHSTGILIDDRTMSEAIMNGHVNCLRYIHESGVPISDAMADLANSFGHVDCLRYTHENGAALREKMAQTAVNNRYIDCLRYLGEAGITIGPGLAEIAAAVGDLPCLRYIYEMCGSLPDDICTISARNNNLDCLQFAHQHGAFWNEDTCRAAARYGHFECLRWAHQNGCLLDLTNNIPPTYYNICQLAADIGNIECLRYCHDSGITLNEFVRRSANASKSIECINYVKTHWTP